MFCIINLIRPISYKGLERMEPLEYPEAALREAILNAIIHKEYSAGTWIYLRVRDDRLTLWNPGPLPGELTIEQLKPIIPPIPATNTSPGSSSWLVTLKIGVGALTRSLKPPWKPDCPNR